MSSLSAIKVYEELRRAAETRLAADRSGKTRVVVQVGHCSQAVGAGEVAAAFAEHLPASAYLVTAGCDGACYNAPQVLVSTSHGRQARYVRVTPVNAQRIAGRLDGTGGDGEATFFSGQRRIALDLCGDVDSEGIDDYISKGGYAGLARALSMEPEQIIEEVKASGLRGRGGAYFPAAAKWESARKVNKPALSLSNGSPRYLVVNSEEGEPGIFKDRHLMEGVPHRVLEGTVMAAYASGASDAFIYINAEAELSAQRMEKAVAQAAEMGLLGQDILGSGFSLTVEIRRGAGGYVCGEETTLLNTMEGYRREPRLRPPFPTESGYLAKPTVINNPETLAGLPFILTNGAKAYADIGTEKATGTKILSLSGAVKRPGVAEVPMGTTLRQIVYDVGGGPPDGRTLMAVAVGGPSSGLLPPSMLDTPIAPGPLHSSGVMLGAGGVIVLDERISVVEVMRKLAAYNAAESCGKCTPCREGTPRMVEAIDQLISGHGSPQDLEELRYLAEVVGSASLCGLGQAAGGPITSAMHFFGDQLAMLVEGPSR